MTRIERLAALLEEPLLVAGPPYVLGGQANVFYLTGLQSSNSAVLVEPDASATLFADFRYAARGREVEGVTFVETARSLLPAIGEHVSGRRILFEEANLPFAGYRALEEAGVDPIPSGGQVEALRAVKDAGEIASMRRAGALSDEIFAALAAERFSGRTERQLVWWVERAFREAGAEGVSFPTVVAAGETGTSPHAVPGDQPIHEGVLVTVDAGCVVDGYCSDCTRTFAVGAIADRLQELYALCQEAQLAGLAAVAPGVSGRDADAASREAIEAAGLGWAYGHGLGHGVGIQIHEGPTLRRESTDVLEPGNVVSVEPGIYVPGEGGVRIEDLVLVTADGCERLTEFTKELVSLVGPAGMPGSDTSVLCGVAMAETVNTNQFRNGMHIEIDGDVWRIVEFQHVKPGKGGAFVRTKLKGLDSGAVVDRTFRAGERFARVHTEVKNVQYLYDDGSEAHFMDEETFDQFGLPHAEVADALAYLTPSSSVQMLAVDGKPAGLQLPASVELTVTQTEPAVRGDTVSNVSKPATLETGAVVQVPLFVDTGERIKVDPREGRYISRA